MIYGIRGSVGNGGTNQKADVELVQGLLIKLGAKIDLTGVCDQRTVAAIRAFQAKYFKASDGRIDTGGRTIRKLVEWNKPGIAPPPPTTQQLMLGELPARFDKHTILSFVRDTVKFKSQPDTKKLCQTIMSYFDKEFIVIGGYLDTDDQYWKVNYHWELLCTKIRFALKKGLSAAHKAEAEKVLAELETNKPNPDSGYLNSPLGTPKDSCSYEVIEQRHATMKKCKERFKVVMDAEQLATKYPPGVLWDLCVAPVAKPGQSNHRFGWALDIYAGEVNRHEKNKRTKAICKSLGATLTYDEKSHVHVEFKNGVRQDA